MDKYISLFLNINNFVPNSYQLDAISNMVDNKDKNVYFFCSNKFIFEGIHKYLSDRISPEDLIYYWDVNGPDYIYSQQSNLEIVYYILESIDKNPNDRKNWLIFVDKISYDFFAKSNKENQLQEKLTHINSKICCI